MKKIINIPLLLAVLFMAGSCSRDFSVHTTDTLPRDANLTEDILIEASNNFGFTLFKEITAAHGDSNIFISPLSVSTALSMAYIGAEGTTAEVMKQTLGYPTLSTEEINRNYKSLITLLTELDPAVRFSIANSAWNRADFNLEPEFVKTLQDYYNAEVAGLDFSDPASVAVINSWVSSKTEGNIDEIITEIHPLTVLFLINALYFKADWTVQFDPQNTSSADFTLADGTVIQYPMMNLTSRFGYFETADFQAIDLAYGNGLYSMSLFLPKQRKTVADVSAQFTAENWTVWLKSFSEMEVSLQMPKFTMEFEIELKDILTAMGMGIAFSDQADFSKINAVRDIFISKVKHKTYLEVDEAGTEAAAVTVVEFRENSVGAAMSLNRPFLFVIRDHHTDTIMFMGVMQNPAE